MKRRKKGCFDVSLPQSVNADHQDVPVFHTDVLGSYTGRTEDALEEPIQDADDL